MRVLFEPLGTSASPISPPIPAYRMAEGGKLNMALNTLHEMRSNPARFPVPNTVCYNVVLKALSYGGRWREARALLREVTKESLESETPDVLDYLSYNAVIWGCAAAGEVGEVRVQVSTR